MGSKMWGLKMVVVVVGLLAMTQQSLQLSTKHPLYGVIQKINSDGPYIGLVLVSDSNQKALNASNAFTPSNDVSVVSIAGREFHIGKINGVDVIYVQTGDTAVNAAATVQILIDLFSIEGIVHFGSAGAVDDSLFIGDVVAPGQVAYTGAWTWRKFNSSSKKGELKFGEYNYPDEGQNLLQSVIFNPTTLYASGKNKTKIFWLPLQNSTWFETATNVLQGVELEHCLSAKKCLPRQPVLVQGLRGSSSDIYIQNADYRDFIYNQFKASIVDQETAAVTLVALSNGLPVIAFRGISNTAGGSTAYKSYSYLGSVNALKVAVKFIGAIGSSQTLHPTY